jgi:predicted O-methyltransferase YrrM
LALAKQLVAAGQTVVAMDMLVDEAMGAAASRSHEEPFAQSLAQAYKSLREAEQSRREHGHELLLAHLKMHWPKLRQPADGRKLHMVEIGTTREDVPGQGSTRKLAEFCKQHGMAFVTVDMDPHNTRAAQRMFEGLGVEFEAVAMKGEDYLRERQAPVDFVFLDAYDFDHGQHSELRQSRYVKFLGSRIDEQACHQMHLDCAQSLLRLLAPNGVICVDDTWIDDGHWTAKGTLAMPFLLEHGFELIDARNRAALLRRCEA